jgi:outer membrane protease
MGGHWELRGQLATSCDSYSGKVEDSDWLWSGVQEPLLHDYETIYSESDCNTRGLNGEAGFRYWFDSSHMPLSPRQYVTYGIGIGYQYEEFSWKASNLDQWYPLYPDEPHDQVEGLVGTYSSIIRIPFIEIAARLENPAYACNVSLGYSPHATTDDVDDHILRTKLSKAHAEGNAIRATLGGRYDLMKYLFCRAQADFLSLSTAGKADAGFYDGEDKGTSWTIDHKVTALQYNLIFMLGLKF